MIAISAEVGEFQTYGSGPGKFEGSRSERLAYLAWCAAMDWSSDSEVGDVSEIGWYAALILRRREDSGGWIVHIDDQGFVTVTSWLRPEHAEMMSSWRALEREAHESETTAYAIVREEPSGMRETRDTVRGADAADALGTYLDETIIPRLVAAGWQDGPGDIMVDSCGCEYVWSHHDDSRDDWSLSELTLCDPCERDTPQDADWLEHESEYAYASWMTARVTDGQ